MKLFSHSPILLNQGVKAKVFSIYKNVFLLLLLASASFLMAQPCIMSCKTGPVFFPLNAGCSKVINPNDLLQFPQTTCAGPKAGIAFNQFNVAIGNTITSAFIGQTLNVTVFDLGSGVTCMTQIMVADTMKPLLICQNDITIGCNESFAPDDLPAPIVIDNCGGIINLTNSDVINNLPCPQPATIFRTWKAVDGSGNSKTCLTKITMARPKLSDVEFLFATNFILPCNSNPEDLTILGQPTIDGNPIDFNGLCDFKSEKKDSIAPAKLPLIGTTYFRTWTVTDLCLNNIITALQVFTVPDVEAPSITCPNDITFEALSNFCPNPVFLPAPLLLNDNCVTSPNLAVQWAFPDKGFGPYNDLPSGVYNVNYIASDYALNADTCSFKVTIIDTFPPVAVCKAEVVIALSNIAPGILFPSSVDDGSNDNCNVVKLELDRLDDAFGFQDSLLFNCNDVGDTIDIELKVSDPSGLFSVCFSKVIVQDKLAPFIVCPPDVTVECSDVFGDFTQYGNVIINEPCLDTVTIDIINQQDNCQVGQILRVFKVSDVAGNMSVCTQTIQVVNSHPFDGTKIKWPENYTSHECIGPDNFDPEDLPEPFNKPILPDNDPCALIAVTHEDHIFTVSMPSCYKIMRTWKVMDWCQYHPDIDPNKGLWTYTQLIKIQDTLAPVIVCVDTVKGSAGPDCKTGFVKFPLIQATDCSPDLKITNNSIYSISKGPDASGTYPVGTTNVMFTVSDQCGNFSFCTVKVVVKDDKAPGVKCKYGLAADLVYMGMPGIMACVPAKAFDAGSNDNCTPIKNLKFSYSSDITDTLKCFNCGDLGKNEIKVWVTDANGNQDYCLTFIDIQDNMFPCIPMLNDTITLAGNIVTETGKDIEEVKVDLKGDMQNYAMTSNEGSFEFLDLPMEKSFEVIPGKDIEPLNGVSTIDIIKLQRHIMGQEALNSPYKLIAADLDGSKKITNNDLFVLKKLILHQINEIPGQQSWKFVDKSYVFPVPTNPWFETYPEKYKDDHLMKANKDVNFIGIKLGDLNNTAIAAKFNENENRTAAETMSMYIDDSEIKADASDEFTVRMNQNQNLQAFQFSIDVSDDLVIENIEAEAFMGKVSDILNFDMESGKIHFSWFDVSGKNFAENQGLIKVKFKTKINGMLSSFIQLSNAANTPEALDKQNKILRPVLNFNQKADLSTGFALLQNRPNPFNMETTIRFRLPETGKATLRIFDMTGRKLIEKNMNLPAGFQEVNITKAELSGPGVYMYSLETEKNRAVARMIMLD